MGLGQLASQLSHPKFQILVPFGGFSESFGSVFHGFIDFIISLKQVINLLSWIFFLRKQDSYGSFCFLMFPKTGWNVFHQKQKVFSPSLIFTYPTIFYLSYLKILVSIMFGMLLSSLLVNEPFIGMGVGFSHTAKHKQGLDFHLICLGWGQLYRVNFI